VAAWYPLPLARASEPGPGSSTATTGRRCAPPAAPHTEHCAPDCGYQHAPACWIEAVFDTDDSYRDDHGGPGTLHQRLVTCLGQWLDAQAVRWSWRNHGDGIIHDHHDGLAGLALLDE
jgi:hypothetical protein